MQIKTIMRYHLIPVRMAIINKQQKKEVLARMWRKGNHFFTVEGNADWCSHCGKQYGDLKKLKMDLPLDPAVPLLGIY